MQTCLYKDAIISTYLLEIEWEIDQRYRERKFAKAIKRGVYMNIIIDVFFNIFFWYFILITVRFNTIHFICFTKCFRIKECTNRKCYFRDYCNKYVDIPTEEEFDRIEKLLKEKRKELLEKQMCK